MSACHVRSQPPSLPPSRHDVGASRKEVLDLQELRDRAGGDEALVLELLGDFLDGGMGLNELCDAVQGHAFEETSRLAHRLEGALLALGAREAATAAREVELHAAALVGGGPPPLDESVERLSFVRDALIRSYDDACRAMRSVVDDAMAMTPSGSAR